MRPAWAAVAIVCSACAAGGAGGAPRLVERARLAMGSELRVGVWTADAGGAERAIAAVFDEFERLDALMSVWKTGSDVERLNAAAGDRPVTVGPDVLEVLRAAREISEWTGGKFDVTFGALSGLWRFDHDQDNRVPDPAEVRRQLPLVDFRSLELDPVAGTAFLRRRGMRVHLGGIGKGYAVDRAAALLRSRGFRDFLIRSGGDMYAAGLRGGRPWHLGVQDPRGAAGRIFAALDVSDRTFSTSGDYERFFFRDGRRYHHIIDPVTGEPARSGCRSVTVVADRAVLADGLSTGIFLLGPKAGLALAARVGVEVIVVTTDNEVVTTPGLAGRLERLGEPTDSP
jgi:thiamine biosynthesis lipoprotein